MSSEYKRSVAVHKNEGDFGKGEAVANKWCERTVQKGSILLQLGRVGRWKKIGAFQSEKKRELGLG